MRRSQGATHAHWHHDNNGNIFALMLTLLVRVLQGGVAIMKHMQCVYTYRVRGVWQ